MMTLGFKGLMVYFTRKWHKDLPLRRVSSYWPLHFKNLHYKGHFFAQNTHKPWHKRHQNA